MIAQDEHLVSSPCIIEIFWLASICQAFNPAYERKISDLPKMLVPLYLIATRVLLPCTELRHPVGTVILRSKRMR